MLKKMICLGIVAFLGCTEESSSGPSSSNQGSNGSFEYPVTPCRATLTEDVAVEDFFGEVLFTVKKGESYVVDDFPLSSFATPVRLYRQEGDVFYSFDIEAKTEGEKDYPLEYDCDEENSGTAFVAFQDITFYGDKDLKEEVCQVKAGDLLNSSGGGYSYEGEVSGEMVYELLSSVSAENCSAEALYFKTSNVEVFGEQYTNMPVGLYQTK